MNIRLLLLLPTALLAIACGGTGSSSSPATISQSPSASPTASGGLLQISDEGHLTQSVTLSPGQCHFAGDLPDPNCTPGSVDPAVTPTTIHSTICVRGWTSTIRPPTSETTPFKYNVAYPAYGVPSGTVSELDHLVPLELGGANDATNLWPEVGSVPNAKDPVENDLKDDVCAGEISLATAQEAIASNWHTVP